MTEEQNDRYLAMLGAKLRAASERVLDHYPELSPEQRAKLLASADRLRSGEWYAVVRAVAATTRGDMDDAIFAAAPTDDHWAMPQLWRVPSGEA